MNASRRLDLTRVKQLLRHIYVICCAIAKSEDHISKMIHAYKMPTVFVVCLRFTEQCAALLRTRARLFKLKAAAQQTTRLCSQTRERFCLEVTFTVRRLPWRLIMLRLL